MQSTLLIPAERNYSKTLNKKFFFWKVNFIKVKIVDVKTVSFDYFLQ